MPSGSLQIRFGRMNWGGLCGHACCREACGVKVRLRFVEEEAKVAKVARGLPNVVSGLDVRELQLGWPCELLAADFIIVLYYGS